MRPTIMISLLPLALVAGCATTGPAPVSVTRFAAAPDIARAPVTPAPGGPATLEQRTYEDAVGRELSRIGFPAADRDSARYFYTAEVMRDTRQGLPRRSPVTIGVGGGTGGYGGGVGLGASFGVGGQRGASDTLVTRLAVRLYERSTNQVVWEGRAESEAPVSRDGGVDRLAAALFRDFPGATGRTIIVR